MHPMAKGTAHEHTLPLVTQGTGSCAPRTVEHVLDALLLLMGGRGAAEEGHQTLSPVIVLGIKLLHTDKS